MEFSVISGINDVVDRIQVSVEHEQTRNKKINK